MLAPFLTGLGTLEELRREGDLAILVHPSASGSYFGLEHGFRPELVLGDVMRLLGADASIYPNVGGRFPLDARTCAAINDRLREPFGDLLPALPTPGGGIDVKLIAHWIGQYGAETLMLIGGSLYLSGQISDATASLRRAIDHAIR